MSTVADLRAVLNAASLRNLKSSGDVWRLGGNDRGAEQLRLELFSCASRFPSVYVHYDGEAPGEPGLREAEQVGPCVWHLPLAATGTDLSAWLYMGNWQLYSRQEPLRELKDLCRASDDAVASLVREQGVGFIIDSFHDNVEWTVGLQSELSDA